MEVLVNFYSDLWIMNLKFVTIILHGDGQNIAINAQEGFSPKPEEVFSKKDNNKYLLVLLIVLSTQNLLSNPTYDEFIKLFT